jgi:hypothetical protein
MKAHRSRIPLVLWFNGAGGINSEYRIDRFGIPAARRFPPFGMRGWFEWTINIVLN